LITSFCFSGAQIAERTHFNCIFPPPEFVFFAVISEPQWSVAKDQWPTNPIQIENYPTDTGIPN
jgi:hypothetical protein